VNAGLLPIVPAANAAGLNTGRFDTRF